MEAMGAGDGGGRRRRSEPAVEAIGAGGTRGGLTVTSRNFYLRNRHTGTHTAVCLTTRWSKGEGREGVEGVA